MDRRNLAAGQLTCSLRRGLSITRMQWSLDFKYDTTDDMPDNFGSMMPVTPSWTFKVIAVARIAHTPPVNPCFFSSKSCASKVIKAAQSAAVQGLTSPASHHTHCPSRDHSNAHLSRRSRHPIHFTKLSCLEIPPFNPYVSLHTNDKNSMHTERGRFPA